MFGQRPTFGASSTFGGFGATNTSSGFGSSSTFGRPAFGAAQTTASAPFGMSQTGTTSLFGQNQTSTSGGVFGSGQTNTFGSSTTGFGSGATTGGTGLFGSSTQNTSSGGLFGSGSTSGFGSNQQTKPFSFGSSTAASAGTGLFGSSGGSTLFGAQQSSGTVVKFNPVSGVDTVPSKTGGSTQEVQTKIEVITAMSEYESKSLEELRVEDYIANRKGPQQGSSSFGFGSQNKLFGTATTSAGSGWLAQSNTGGSLFGSKPAENKPFSTGFGASTSTGGGLFGASTSTTPFGQTSTAQSGFSSFGQNKPTGFGFGQQQTTSSGSLFGQNTSSQSNAFGAPSTGFGFGNQQQTGGLFGQTKPVFGSTSSGGLFGSKPAGTGFGFGTSTAATPFGTTTSTTGGLFGNTANKTPFSIGTSSTGFGSPAPVFGSGGGLFGNTNQAKPGGLFGSTTGGFGAAQSTGFSLNQPSTGSGLFGNQPATGGGLFGNTNTNFGAGTNFSLNQNQMGSSALSGAVNNNAGIVTDANISNLIKALTHNPFGTSSLLKRALPPTGKADELINPVTSPTSNECKSSLSNQAPTYVLPSSTLTNANKIKPVNLNRAANGGCGGDSKKLMFAGLDERGDSEDVFKVKPFPTVKKLNLSVFQKKGNTTDSSELSTGLNSGLTSNLNTGMSNSLTNLSSPQEISDHTNKNLSPLNENDISPTPNFIKGAALTTASNENHFNDTFVDLKVAQKKSVTDSHTNEVLSNNDNQGTPQDNVKDVQPKSHPAGIKLTRSGYYVIPSMEELAEMVGTDGSCLVQNFTVGRCGYGNVCFLGVTNVSGLDLDSTVFIVRKEIEVYPEGVEKPPVGEKLNKTSYVTLDCVWPVDKSSHEVIKCQERINAMGWVQYLERQCLKMEAAFVEYRPETGSWVFEVSHFSKYGLHDDENEPPPGQTIPASVTSVQKLPLQPSAEGQNVVSSIFNFFDQDKSIESAAVPSSNLFTDNEPVTAIGLQESASDSALFCENLEKNISKRYLDGSTFYPGDDMDETYAYKSDEIDIMPASVLSPSSERLTLSSKAPPTAIQSLKSQLFCEEIENKEMEQESSRRHFSGFKDFMKDRQKREFSMLTTSISDLESEQISSKRFIPDSSRTFDISGISRLEPDISASKDVTHVQSAAADQSRLSTNYENEDDEIADDSFLRDARTTYELLPSRPDPYFEMAKIDVRSSKEIPLHKSQISKNVSAKRDHAVFMSRSFRVGWGPKLTLVHCGLPLDGIPYFTDEEEKTEKSSNLETSHNFLFKDAEPRYGIRKENFLSCKKSRYNVTFEKLSLLDRDDRCKIEPSVESCLKVLLNCSEFSYTDDFEVQNIENSQLESNFKTICPYLSPKKGITLLHKLAEISDINRYSYTLSYSTSLSTIFKLCVALWGRLDFYSPEIDGDSLYAKEQARKEALSRWLEDVSENLVASETENSDNEEDYLSAVLSYLTVRNVGKAFELCQSKGDHYMALLISSSCLSDDAPKQILSEKLAQWSWMHSDRFISKTRLKIYALLSGISFHESSDGPVKFLEGFDWKRCLALLTWYVCPVTFSIDEILNEYKICCGIEKNEDCPPVCAGPSPPYSEYHPLEQKNHDMGFQLLNLYVDPSHSLEKLLDTTSHTPDYLNVSTSWFVWSILQSLGKTLLTQSKVNSLNDSMIALLESTGDWHWSIFVALFIKEDKLRESTVCNLLNHHILIDTEDASDEKSYLEKENFVLSNLKVPEEFVNGAKAVRAKTLNLVDEECWFSIQSNAIEYAHKMLLDTIAPNAVINEDHAFLQAYVQEFVNEDRYKNVTSWDVGGGVYLAYLDALKQVDDMKQLYEISSNETQRSNMERAKSRLLSLCMKLNHLKCSTSVQKYCISEMSNMAICLLRSLIEDLQEVRGVAQLLSQFPLTNDCALDQLNYLTNYYIRIVSNVEVQVMDDEDE